MKSIFTPLFFLVSFFVSAQDGILDIQFGGTGFITTPLPTGGGVVKAEKLKITVISGGYIYQCYSVANTINSDGDFGLVRYNDDGTVDASFGSSGFVRVDVGGDDAPTSLVVLADGSIVLGGYSVSASSGKFALAKISSSGSPVNAFGTSGIVTTTIGTDAYAYSLIKQADGKLVLAGYAKPAGVSFNDFAVSRYDAVSGALDGTFGTGGIVTTPIGSNDDDAFSVKQQADGKLVVAGYSVSGGGNKNFALARYTTSGTLDGSFGSGGTVTTAIGSDDIAYSLDFTPAGNIVAAGISYTGANNDFALAQYTSAGLPDANFGSGGLKTINMGTGINPGTASNDFAHDVLVQADGKIIVAGYVDPNPDPTYNDQDYAVLRLLSNGTPDNAFGPNNNGRNVLVQSGDDIAYSLALQNSKILVGGVSGASLSMARLNNIPPVPLAATLLSFNAVKQYNNTVLLQWQTATETATSKFEVERSADGRSFLSVGAVAAAGNSSNNKSYSLADLQPLPGVTYYRLKIINTDGSFQYSRSVQVKFESSNDLLAFPNPVRTVVQVQVKTGKGEVRLQLFDVAGRLVKQQALYSAGDKLVTSFDMSGLQPGVYTLVVNAQTLRLVKE